MLALIAIICFPFLIWTAWKNVRLSRESARWPTAPGTITASERTKIAWRTQPRVTYSYRVEGRDYSGTRVNLSGGVPVKETEPILNRYPLGASVTVAYSPQDHALAILEPGPNRHVSAILRGYVIWFVVIVGLNGAEFWVVSKQKADEASKPQAPTYDDAAASDPGLGDRLIRESADKGDAKDEGYVGAWYLGGLEGYAKDPVEAAKWLRKSADQGDATSQSLLAELYVNGNGVPKDLAQAVQLFQKAADQGDPIGCLGMGRAYEKGVGGIPQDKQKAIEWYKKAGDNPLAKQGLARLGAE